MYNTYFGWNGEGAWPVSELAVEFTVSQPSLNNIEGVKLADMQHVRPATATHTCQGRA